MTAKLPTPIHSTFTIERRFAAAPARVYQAFANKEAKHAWFRAPGGNVEDNHFDFRAGGNERVIGRHEDGSKTLFDAHYHHVIAEQQIVYSYYMEIDDRPLSVSLATIALVPDGSGTKLVFTEQGVFLDGKDGTESRRHGTDWLFGKLAESVGG
jgi:uncharacterized protein YndB with AHSA1/START domain